MHDPCTADGLLCSFAICCIAAAFSLQSWFGHAVFILFEESIMKDEYECSQTAFAVE